MKRQLSIALLLVAAAVSLRAQAYVYLPKDPTLLSSQVQTDLAAALIASPAVGIVVELPWSTADSGTSSTGPQLNTSALQTFDNDLKVIVGNPPNGYKIGIIFDPVQGGIGVGGNNASVTPSYVFTTAWAGNALCVGCSSSAPQDVAYCNNYQGSPANGFSQSNVGSNVWNVNTFPTGGSATWDHSGAPLVWEAPYVQAYTQIIPLVISYYKNTSIWKNQIGYFRWGIGTGGSSVVACPNVMSGSFAGQTGLPQSGQALTETLWHNAHNAVYASVQANGTGFPHEGSGMYGGETLSNGDGSTPLAWADDDAASGVSYGLGIGTQSLSGNTTNGDQVMYAAGSACSNDWCAMFNTYCAGQSPAAPICYLQTITTSQPTCLLQAATCNQTGSLLTVFPFATERHTRLLEVSYLDMLCAYSANGSVDDANCNVTSPYAPYQTAILNAGNGVPAATALSSGKVVMSGKVGMQ